MLRVTAFSNRRQLLQHPRSLPDRQPDPRPRLAYTGRAMTLHYSPAWLAATKQRPNARRGNYARSKSGSFAILAAIRRASSLVMRLAAVAGRAPLRNTRRRY